MQCNKTAADAKHEGDSGEADYDESARSDGAASPQGKARTSLLRKKRTPAQKASLPRKRGE